MCWIDSGRWKRREGELAKQAGGACVFPDDDWKQVNGLLDYVTAAYQGVNAGANGQSDLVAAAHKRIQELDREIERIRPVYEQGRPKKGKPPGRWFDEGRAYSVWLLAHTEWARRNGAGTAVNFKVFKKASTRELIYLAQQIGWDPLPVRPDGAALFVGEIKTLEQSICQGRKMLSIVGKGWQSTRCEGIFRKLLEYRANDKPS
jgi:hypothetical protein